LAVFGTAMMRDGIAAEQRNGPPTSNRLVTFDLPAQPLDTAIESYSIASGWQVIYDASLAIGRRSAPIKGDFAPTDALRMLLAGTGLRPEHMAVDGIMLLPEPTGAAHQEIAADPAPNFRGYYGRIQAGLKRAFCADHQIRAGAYRIALGFWIGSSGTVTRALALGSTGRAEIDAAFHRAMSSLALGDPPPVGFDQPVVIVVTPDLVSQCRAGEAGHRRADR
jgi:hypothetical protein